MIKIPTLAQCIVRSLTPAHRSAETSRGSRVGSAIPQRPLDRLGTDVLDRVFSYASPGDVIRGAAVSRGLREALVQPGSTDVKSTLSSTYGALAVGDDPRSYARRTGLEAAVEVLRRAERLRLHGTWTDNEVLTREQLLQKYPIADELPDIADKLTATGFSSPRDNIHAFSPDGSILVGVDHPVDYDRIAEVGYPSFYRRQDDGSYRRVCSPGVVSVLHMNAYASKVEFTGNAGCIITYTMCPVSYAVQWGARAPAGSLETRVDGYRFDPRA